MSNAPTPHTPDFVATPEERELLAMLGDAGACSALSLPRSTLARIAAGWPCRRGTLLVFRERLREWREAQGAAPIARGA